MEALTLAKWRNQCLELDLELMLSYQLPDLSFGIDFPIAPALKSEISSQD